MEEPNPAHAPDGRSSSSLQLLSGLFPITADYSCKQVTAEKSSSKRGSRSWPDRPMDVQRSIEGFY